jgi:MHS family proline/betaine transporter-like MFS transporter
MARPPQTARALAAGVIGNMLEWYDFAIYGYFAAQIGRTFFPSHDPVTEVLSAFGVFAVGYLMRPLGGAVVGSIGDRFGRRAALTFAIAAMAIPTFLVGILPGFDTLGLAAPVILTLLRMVQGLSIGGECSAALAFLYEQAPPGRRGVATALGFCGTCGGTMLGAATGSLVASLMTAEDMAQWGWRIPFLLGLVVGIIGYVLRRNVREAGPTYTGTRGPVSDAVRQHLALLIWMSGLAVFATVDFYLVFLYSVSWLQTVDGISPAQALGINTASMIGLLIVVMAGGVLADRLDRRALLGGALGVALVAAYPLLWLMHHPDPALIALGQAGFVITLGLYNGALGLTLVEATPREVRCSALGLGYNIPRGLVGGLSPLAAAWLVHRTGNDLSPAWMIVAAAAVSLLALLYRPRLQTASP